MSAPTSEALASLPGAPATPELVQHLAQTVAERYGHEHPTSGEDLFCLNHTSYMGERMGPVLVRLRDAEAEVERLQRAVQLLGTHLQGGARDFVDALAEIERRLPIEHVERFLKRERDRHEKTDVSWAALDDALDAFRLHMVTGTPLTEPRPAEGVVAYGEGTEPLTEAEDLRAELERVRAELHDLRGQNAMTESNFDNFAEGAIAEQDQLRERAEAAEEKLRQVAEAPVHTDAEGREVVLVSDLAAGLLPPAPADEPTPEQARLRAALREAGERAAICTCSEFGPCPACAPDAEALTAALAEEAGDLNG
ncbi:hypothetical protein [Microbispora rosea]|uniref:hypothetical protein n=1 Tax=Microbispora rosea TaxID=58117 RepID=UPI0037AAC6DB